MKIKLRLRRFHHHSRSTLHTQSPVWIPQQYGLTLGLWFEPYLLLYRWHRSQSKTEKPLFRRTQIDLPLLLSKYFQIYLSGSTLQLGFYFKLWSAIV